MTVAAVVNLWSMGGGFTRALLESYREGTSTLLLYLTLAVPVGGRLVPIVGIGDLVVGGAAAAALLRLGVRPLGIASALADGLLGALAYGRWRGGAPALPFVAVAVLVPIGWPRIRRNAKPPAPVDGT